MVVCVNKDCQQVISITNLERHLKRSHSYLQNDITGLETKIKDLFGIHDEVVEDSDTLEIKVTKELLTPVAGLPIKKGFKCLFCLPTESFYSTSKASMIEHFSRNHSKNLINQDTTPLLHRDKYQECYIQSLSLKSKKRCFGVDYIEANYIQPNETSTQLNEEDTRLHVTELIENFGSNISHVPNSIVRIPNPFLKTLQWPTMMEKKNWQVSRAIVNIEPLDNMEKLLVVCIERYIIDSNEKLKSASYNLKELVGKENG